MKKILSIIITFIICASVFILPASAAGTVIAFSQNTIVIGDKVVVTVTIDAGESIYAIGFKLNYDAEKLNYDGGNAAGVIKVVESPSGESKFTKQFTFTSIAVGGAAVKVDECQYAGEDLVEKDISGASATLTIKDVALSNNANLSSLTLSTGTLSPAFNASRTNYTVSVPYEAANITLYAKTADTNAKVAISSNPTNLNVGANTIKVTVTAQNGSQKIYTVVVTRREQGVENPPDVPPVQENPYETVISGKSYEIVTNIPEAAYLKGFELSSSEYNGKQVPVLRDKNNVFTVYYLREVGSTEIAPYTKNEELDTFEALKYMTFNDSLYIFTEFENGITMPSNYYSTYTNIGDFSVKVYLDSNSKMSDFAYVYCYAFGDFGIYRYDSKEGTIQRYPEIRPVDAPVVNDDTPKTDSIVTRFSTLTTNAKILLIGMLIASICVAVLIVFLIIMIVRKIKDKKSRIIGSDDYDFEDVTIVGDDDIFSNSK